MTNQTKSTKRIVILNGVETAIITHYALQKGALGDYAWHRTDITFERASKKDAIEKEYKISNKRLAYIDGKTSTTFDIYSLEQGAWILLGGGFVKSTGVARDRKCLNAYLTEFWGC